MALEGKGFYIWKIKNCEGGESKRIAAEAENAGLSHVLIKVANGTYSYNYDWNKKIDLVPPVAKAIQKKGIQVWGWHYVYGDQPISEARVAIKRIQELNLDGYVIDAEAEYKQSGKASAAKQFMRELRSGIGSKVPVALTSYRYPSLHPIPWNEFLEKCDYNMPQVYWIRAHNPDAQLTKTLLEFESPKIKYRPPIIPVGAAFREHGWEPSSKEVIEFLKTARDLKVSAVNFWEWYACRETLQPENEMWKIISEFEWNTQVEDPKDIAEVYIETLNTKDVEKIVGLYNDRSVHITSSRTVLGKSSIHAWFETFFNHLIPNADFSLTGFSGSGNTRHFTWKANSDTLKVLNGNDTIGLADGKISYHYTYFTVS